LRRAVELDPNCAIAHAFLGFYLSQRVIDNASSDPVKDSEESVAAVEQALLLEPGDPEVLENSGIVFFNSGKSQRAIEALRRGVEKAPLNFVAWGYLALTLGWTGEGQDLQEAHAIFDRLIASAPDHPSLPYWLCFKAGIFGREGKHQEAADCGRRGVLLQPRFTPGLAEYANALAHLGRTEEAMQQIVQLMTVNPKASQEAYMLALLVCTGSRERAETHISGLIAAGIFKGDIPWPALPHPDPASRPRNFES
jgi:tetratricopeptide (TPR) repeat protein